MSEEARALADARMAQLPDPHQHVGGVPWYDAPKPRRLHKCKPQTTGWVGLDLIDRCACGAIRRNGGIWALRNSR